MCQCNYASSIANTCVSALGYYHRLAGASDLTKVFWVLEMLKGYGKLGSRLDTLMPITLSILPIVLQQTSTVCASEYRSYLFKVMCTTALFAFSCVGPCFS